MSEYTRQFGKHVRSLRRARGLTQEKLAERSGLAVDTIRRAEHGTFSASIDTLQKLCDGFGLAISTLFEGFELGHRDQRRELFDLISNCSDEDIALVTSVMRTLLDELAKSRSGGT